MRSQQVTIKDIAKELGVSASTVSRALKDHPDISKETKDKIKDLAQKRGYRPNLVALSLRNSQTKIIGVIIPSIVHHFFSTVISGIEEIAYKNGYNILLCQTNENYAREVSDAHALLLSRVDGVLISITKETKNFDHLKNLEENGIPMVFFDRICEEIDTDRVVIDDYNGAFMATEHLIEQGCERIAHYGTQDHLLIGKKRKQGYIDALKKHDMPIDESIIVKCDTNEEALVMTKDIFTRPNCPDGVFTVNDLTAAGTIVSLRELGYHIPNDIAVCGFGAGLISKIIDPQLTSVLQFGEKMGEMATKLLIERILNKEEDHSTQTITLNSKMVIRKSSQKKRY